MCPEGAHCATLLAFPLVFYLTLPTRNFYWDGVAFAINIEKRLPAASLLHPNHLLYTLWGAWLYGLSESMGIHTRALFVMQAANGVLAGFSVILLYVYLRLRKVPESFGVPLALIFGFSATWWKFATDADAYVVSIFLLLCAGILIEHPRTVVLAGLVQAGAILFHELAILFFIVALVRLKKNHRSIAVYVSAAVIPSVLAYVVAYIAVSSHATIPGLFSWLISHSPDSGFSFNPLTNTAFSLRGTLRLLAGGKLANFVGDGISKAALPALGIAIVASAAGWWRAARMRARVSAPPLDLLVWVGVYFAFLFFWMPQDTFYRLFYLAPLIAIFGTMLCCAPATRLAVWLFVPALLLWNFLFLAYPESRLEFNAPLRFALEQRKVWAPGTPILFHRFHPDLWTISYFNQQAAWIGIEQGGLSELERDLEYARREKKPLWLEASAYDFIAATPDGQGWLAAHEMRNELLKFSDGKHEFRFYCVR